LSSGQIDELDGVNILLVPIGGGSTIDAVQAAQVISDIGPNIVIPMHYSRDGMLPELRSTLQPVDTFLKEMGKQDVVPQAKLSITKDKMPAEMQVVVLE